MPFGSHQSELNWDTADDGCFEKKVKLFAGHLTSSSDSKDTHCDLCTEKLAVLAHEISDSVLLRCWRQNDSSSPKKVPTNSHTRMRAEYTAGSISNRTAVAQYTLTQEISYCISSLLKYFLAVYPSKHPSPKAALSSVLKFFAISWHALL